MEPMSSIAIELYRSVALSACEAISPEAAVLNCLTRICRLMDWQVGHVYLPSDNLDSLATGGLWYLSDPIRFGAYKAYTETLVITPGIGLVGTAFASGEARWISDASCATGFLRAPQALEVGLRSAFAFPIRTHESTLGVMEFFTTRSIAVEPELFTTMEDMAQLLGEVIQRKQMESALMRRAVSSDPLTHLPNRAHFSQRLQQAIAASRRSGVPGAVLFLDLDRFKVVNETLGHEAGDRLLRAVAERLLPFGRQYDHLGRLGGDEFTLLLPELERPEDGREAANAIMETFERPFTLDEHSLYLTVSIGGSHFPTDGDDAATLMKHASIALEEAKKHQSMATFYQPTMRSATSERLILEHHLRKALDNNELVLHYQPQVCLHSGAIVGAEVLVRWQHPDMGLISPGKFIPLAEETGLIMPMTEQILRKACVQGRQWQDEGLPSIRLAVNLSGNHFKRSGLDESIRTILQSSGFPAACLELELTEGIMMENVEATIATLTRLNAQGIQFAVDDFGTGYSSLSYLKRFPLSVLKIDQSFVRDIATDPEDRAIVSAIIALAHRLHLEVIAEGVETEEQLRYLQEQGCDYAQGYFFSRPVAGSLFKAQLESERMRPLGASVLQRIAV
jgi:diguanylate cyclase (GGDEF)-like protein